MRAEPGRRIALVLGSGGARGLAHIGVIETLQSRGFEVAAVAGSSMGALVGGVFAAGRLSDYRDWACGLERGDVLRLLDFAFGHPGLIRGERVIGALRELVGEHRIEDLPIPYTAVASDLDRQREVWFTRGPLFDAIRASIAIPMVFTPHRVDGRELVDGGLLAPVPIAATRAMRADRVFTVDVNSIGPWLPTIAPSDTQALADTPRPPDPGNHEGDASGPSLRERMSSLWQGLVERNGSGGAEASKPRGVMDLMSRALDTMQARVARLQLAMDPPDLQIEIDRHACQFYEFWRAKEMIEIGRAATLKALDNAGL
ncbi:MAG TPA: patatin-like phospholipase family protein [Arenimonas sp.]|nr:patatin-like phospholipase family protein [Arenimonas sp.]